MLAVRAGRSFDGLTFQPAGSVVLMQDGLIDAVLPATVAPPDGCPVLDFPDCTLLPGLIDTHVHLCGDDSVLALEKLPEYDPDGLQAVIRRGVEIQLSAGVTSVRDLGDLNFAVVDMRADLGLTVVASGPPMTIPAGHCANMGGAVSGGDSIRSAIAERVERGVDVVKVMASGGIITPGSDLMTAQFSADDFQLMVDESHAAGLPIVAHAHALAAVEMALAAGVDGIEHCTCATGAGLSMSQDLLNRLVAAQIPVCPTLGVTPGVVPPPRIQEIFDRLGFSVESRLAHVGRMWSAGVRLISGGDSGINPAKPHGILIQALLELAESGLPLDRVLASATSVAATACGLGSGKGLLRSGFDADLLLVRGDLSTDLGALAAVEAVFVGGAQVRGTQVRAKQVRATQARGKQMRADQP